MPSAIAGAINRPPTIAKFCAAAQSSNITVTLCGVKLSCIMLLLSILNTCLDWRQVTALSAVQPAHDAAPQTADALRNLPRNQSIAFACQKLRFRAVVPEAKFIHRAPLRRAVVLHDNTP